MNRFPLKIFSGFLASLLMVGAMTGCKNPFSNGGGIIQELNTAKAVKAPKTVKELSASAPVDADGDLIPDGEDACPKTAGIPQDNRFFTGCPAGILSGSAKAAEEPAPLVSCTDPRLAKVREACENELRWEVERVKPANKDDFSAFFVEVYANEILNRSGCLAEPGPKTCAYAYWRNRDTMKRLRPVLQEILDYTGGPNARVPDPKPNSKPSPKTGGQGKKPAPAKKPEGKFDPGIGQGNLEANFGNSPPESVAVRPPDPGSPAVKPVKQTNDRKKKLVCKPGFQLIANGLNIECKKKPAPKVAEKSRDQWLNDFNARFAAQDVDWICSNFATLKGQFPMNTNLESMRNRCPGHAAKQKKGILDRTIYKIPGVKGVLKGAEDLCSRDKGVCLTIGGYLYSDYKEDKRNAKRNKALRSLVPAAPVPAQIPTPVNGTGNDLTVPGDTQVPGVTPGTHDSNIPAVINYQTLTHPENNGVMAPVVAPPTSEPAPTPAVINSSPVVAPLPTQTIAPVIQGPAQLPGVPAE